MTTEREPAPVWASFGDWWEAERVRAWADGRRWPRAKDAWGARQPEIEALKAENQALTEACRALRDAYGVLKEAAHAVWDAKSQSGDAIAAWTRLIDVLEHRAQEG